MFLILILTNAITVLLKFFQIYRVFCACFLYVGNNTDNFDRIRE